MIIEKTKLREDIERYMRRPGKLERIADIKLVEKAKKKKVHIGNGIHLRVYEGNCITYFFNDNCRDIFHPSCVYSDKVIAIPTNGLTKITEPQNDCMVLYVDVDTEELHVGRWDEGKVVSKWGNGGHVYRHALEAVPNIYGTDVMFFKKP